MRILIVEDDFVSGKLLKTILSPIGECEIAEDGAIGMEKLKKSFAEENYYALVCLDIMLPEFSGYDVLEYLRTLEKEYGITESIKVIMITALGDSESIKKSFKEKAEAYLIKPVYKDKLMDIIKRLGLSDN